MTSHERHVVASHRSLGCLFNNLNGLTTEKHQSRHYRPFVRGIYRWPVNSPHKGPVTRKELPFDDVIMKKGQTLVSEPAWPYRYLASWTFLLNLVKFYCASVQICKIWDTIDHNMRVSAIFICQCRLFLSIVWLAICTWSTLLTLKSVASSARHQPPCWHSRHFVTGIAAPLSASTLKLSDLGVLEMLLFARS